MIATSRRGVRIEPDQTCVLRVKPRTNTDGQPVVLAALERFTCFTRASGGCDIRDGRSAPARLRELSPASHCRDRASALRGARRALPCSFVLSASNALASPIGKTALELRRITRLAFRSPSLRTTRTRATTIRFGAIWFSAARIAARVLFAAGIENVGELIRAWAVRPRLERFLEIILRTGKIAARRRGTGRH